VDPLVRHGVPLQDRSPEAIRRAAADYGFSVDAVTEVRVLDPYFYC
jgi:hypothetical protein